jgi:hypothetical protein
VAFLGAVMAGRSFKGAEARNPSKRAASADLSFPCNSSRKTRNMSRGEMLIGVPLSVSTRKFKGTPMRYRIAPPLGLGLVTATPLVADAANSAGTAAGNSADRANSMAKSALNQT